MVLPTKAGKYTTFHNIQIYDDIFFPLHHHWWKEEENQLVIDDADS